MNLQTIPAEYEEENRPAQENLKAAEKQKIFFHLFNLGQ